MMQKRCGYQHHFKTYTFNFLVKTKALITSYPSTASYDVHRSYTLPHGINNQF
ncbi:hypothetical protein M758_1G139900 [Ceratodon purpureus]|nr:hypothetical protein M758_1G139900 [Ceratodon purpureus]